MRKLFLLISTMLPMWSIVLAQEANNSYEQNFESKMGDMNIVNIDEASPTFAHSSYYGYNYTGGTVYNGSSSFQADDYLVTPGIQLEAGNVYDFSLVYKNSSSIAYEMMLLAGDGVSSLTDTIAVQKAAENRYDFDEISGKYLAKKTGVYHFGLYLRAAAGSGSIYFDNFIVSIGVSGKVPGDLTEISAQSRVDKDIWVVDVSCKTPIVDYAGNTLEGTIDINLERNSQVIATKTGVSPGDVVTFTDLEPLDTRVSYTCQASNASGNSKSVSVDFQPIFATPMKVSSVAWEKNENKVSLTWDAVTQPTSTSGIFLPSKIVYSVKRNDVVIAENLSVTSFEDIYEMPESGQDILAYSVTAHNGPNRSLGTSTEQITMGNPYTNAFAESFANYTFQTKTWTTMESNRWITTSSSYYNPQCDAQDGDQGFLKCQNYGTVNTWIASPFINLSGMKNPCVEFYAFQDSSLTTDSQVEVKIRINGDDISLGEPMSLLGGPKGWNKQSFFIPKEYASQNFQLVFDAMPASASFCIDNLVIKDVLDYNLCIEQLSVEASPKIGETVLVEAVVKNTGLNIAEHYDVSFTLDDVLLENVVCESIAHDSINVVSAPLYITPMMAGKKHSIKACVVYYQDEAELDNQAEVQYEVRTNDFPVPTNLVTKADHMTKRISLIWERAQISTESVEENIVEDFELWTSGTTEAEQGWIFIDNDGKNTNGIGGVNEQIPMAAMIAENVNYYQPHSGTKMLGISGPYSYRDTPDDWVISPEVIGGQTIKFYVASYDNYGYPFGADQFDVCYSTGGTSPEDFIVIGEKQNVESKDWVEITVTLPVEATRFAIHVTKFSNRGLLFDDFSFIKGVKPLQLNSYNIYRDGVKYATVDSITVNYTDTVAEVEKIYSYAISAVYDRGESMASVESNIQLNYIPEYSLALTNVSAPATATRRQTICVCVTLENQGRQDANGYSVQFMADGVEFANAKGVEIQTGETKDLSAEFTVTPEMLNTTLKFSVNLIFGFDENQEDNFGSAEVSVVENEYPKPQKFQAVYNEENNEINLDWEAPTQADSQGLELKGYNLYRDGELISSSIISELTYTDTAVETDNSYQYTIAAVYNEGESMETDPVSVKTVSIERVEVSELVLGVDGGILFRCPESSVAVYQINGMKVVDSTVKDGQLLPLEAGIYLVKIGDDVVRCLVR